MTGESKPLTGARVLVVDDDEDVREYVAEALSVAGAAAGLAADGLEALDFLSEHAVDVIVSDVRMPGCDGLQLIERVRARGPNPPPFVIMTGFFDVSAQKIEELGAHAVLQKPLESRDLVASVAACLRKPRAV